MAGPCACSRAARLRNPSYLVHTGDPVSRGFSIPSQATPKYWIIRVRGYQHDGNCKCRAAPPSRAERVGILDYIGAAAGGCPGREQDEPRGGKYRGRKIAASRQIVRDVLVR